MTFFLLLIDSLEEKSKPLLNYLIRTHKARSIKINYFVFEGVFNTIKNDTNIELHDFVSEIPTVESFSKKLKIATQEGIVVIDSLSNAIIYYGFPRVYRLLHEVCNNRSNVV